MPTHNDSSVLAWGHKSCAARISLTKGKHRHNPKLRVDIVEDIDLLDATDIEGSISISTGLLQAKMRLKTLGTWQKTYYAYLIQ